MKSNLAFIGAVCVTALAMAILGTGVATADNYAGKKYSDAAKAARDAKQTVVIASRFGAALAQDDCIVIRSQSSPFLAGNKFKHVTDTLQFYLNCNGAVASATKPGNSAATPEGRAAKAAQQDAAQ